MFSIITPWTHYFYPLPWGPCLLVLIGSSFKKQAYSPASSLAILLMVMVSFWKASFSSPFRGCGMQLHSGWRTDPEASSLFPNTQISVVRLRAFKEQPFSRSIWHCGAFLVEQSVCWVSLTWTYPMLIPRASLFGDLQFPTTSALVHLREVSEGSRATYVSLVLENVKLYT